MKKKIILLPLLVLALTACDGFDLNNLMGGSGNNNNNASVEPAERSFPTNYCEGTNNCSCFPLNPTEIS